jgi:spermidine synthase
VAASRLDAAAGRLVSVAAPGGESPYPVAMRPTTRIAEARTPAGEALVLTEHDGTWSVSVGRDMLMSSAAHHSEEEMAELVDGGPDARILVGGLGMGYTLRAVLDRLGAEGRVDVVELIPAVVEWNRGPLAPLAGRPLEDPRVSVEIRDVVGHVAAHRNTWDGILLDVDNGPEAFTTPGNARMYRQPGLRTLLRALRPGGVLVIWSAFDSPAFVRALSKAGFRADALRTHARGGGRKRNRHTLFIGRRGDR